MKPIGILMREHRIIERMLVLLEKEKEAIKSSGKVRIDFLTSAIDFFRVYVDKNHHGKEEDVLFHHLSIKPLSIEQRRIISQLIDEHNIARSFIRALDGARERYLRNHLDATRGVIDTIERMQTLYASHIETEEKHFYYPAMEHFSEEEQAQMIQEFFAYEQTMNMERYESMVKQYEAQPPIITKKIYGV